jgi:hypothetical protein
MPFEHGLQSALDQVDIGLGRLDARLRFLLERVKHVNALGDPNGVAR